MIRAIVVILMVVVLGLAFVSALDKQAEIDQAKARQHSSTFPYATK